jgi:hypothetical protein
MLGFQCSSLSTELNPNTGVVPAGPEWGDKGYIKLVRGLSGASMGQCGIAMQASYPTKTSPNPPPTPPSPPEPPAPPGPEPTQCDEATTCPNGTPSVVAQGLECSVWHACLGG